MPGKSKGPKSKAQMRLFGAVASGSVKIKGFSKKEALDKLRGSKAKGLPQKKKSK